MAELIQKYRARDGREFGSESEANRHDNLLDRIDEAMSPLGKHQDIAYGRWVQHSKEACEQAKSGILAIIREQLSAKDWPILNRPDGEIGMFSIIGRVLDDSDSALNRPWCRLSRINWENFREYDQPYYAMHPTEAK